MGLISRDLLDSKNTIDGNMLEHALGANEAMNCKYCRNTRSLEIPEPTVGK
jgi:hypothetical protein